MLSAAPTATAQDFVSDILPYPLDFINYRINIEFNSDDRAFFEDYNAAIYDLPEGAKKISDLSPEAYNKFMEFPLVRANKFYVFYGAYKNKQHILRDINSYSVLGLNNPALQRYAKLSADDRENDIYLWSPDTPYWYSEFTSDGKSLPFRSYFIVHLRAVDDKNTEVEVIEDRPVVSMGKRKTIDANGVVHKFDIRDSSPSTGDREFLLSCIKQFIDRDVPGRHWFNCRGENGAQKAEN